MSINKLVNDDCMKIIKGMQDLSVDLTIADIPYGNVSQLGEERAKYAGQLRKIDKEHADIITFDEIDFCEQLSRVTKNSIYVFCGIDQIANIYNYFKITKKKDWMARLCVWHKTNPSPANGQHMFLSATEFIIFAKRRRTLFNGHCEHNVFNFPAGRSKLHPTEKPQAILKYMIEMSSNEGDVVFDPVCGSASAMVAAMDLNRRFYGIELNEEYYNLAKDRINNHINTHNLQDKYSELA